MPGGTPVFCNRVTPASAFGRRWHPPAVATHQGDRGRRHDAEGHGYGREAVRHPLPGHAPGFRVGGAVAGSGRSVDDRLDGGDPVHQRPGCRHGSGEGIVTGAAEGLRADVGRLHLRTARRLSGGEGAAEFRRFQQVGLGVRGEDPGLGRVVVVEPGIRTAVRVPAGRLARCRSVRPWRSGRRRVGRARRERVTSRGEGRVFSPKLEHRVTRDRMDGSRVEPRASREAAGPFLGGPDRQAALAALEQLPTTGYARAGSLPGSSGSVPRRIQPGPGCRGPRSARPRLGRGRDTRRPRRTPSPYPVRQLTVRQWVRRPGCSGRRKRAGGAGPVATGTLGRRPVRAAGAGLPVGHGVPPGAGAAFQVAGNPL